MKAGWEIKTLGEVSKVGAGNSAPQKSENFDDGIYPFFRTSDAGKVRFGDIYESRDYLNDLGIKGLNKFPKGTIVLPKSGASTFLNHRVMLGVDGFVSSHLATIIGSEDKANGRFILYFLSTILAQDLIQDHAYPSLKLSDIAEIKIPLPPLPEQKRLVTLLDEAFESIATAKANAEQNLKNARALFESHLNEVFTKRGEGWEEKTFEDIIDSNLIGLTKNSTEQGSDKAWRYVKMNNITRDNRFDFTNHVYVDANDDEQNKFQLKNGDFLFNTRNSFELVGKVCLFENDTDEIVLFNNNIMRVRFKNDIVAKFVLLAFSSKPVADALNSMKNGTTNVSAIYFKDLKSLLIPIPPSNTQQKLANDLSVLSEETQRLEALYSRKIAALDELKKALLHRAFSGEL